MELVSRFVSIRALSIRYCVAAPSGPVRHKVFLLSSPGLSADCWRGIVPELTQAGCLCVLCDMPGFGQSEFNDRIPLSQPLRARYLWGLLDALDLESEGRLGCWHLMAHGSACGTIAEMALQQPDSAASLFMISPMLYSPVPRALRPLVRSNAFNGLIRFWFRRSIAPSARFSRLLGRIYGRPVRREQADRLHRALLRLIGHEDTVRRMLLEGYSVNTAGLSALFAPAMVLWGGRDALLGGTIPARLRERDFSAAEYHLLPSAGHCAMETNSRAVRDFLRGWIREMWS